MSGQNGSPSPDRRASWSQYQLYVLAELKNLKTQCEKIETHLLTFFDRVDNKFVEMDRRMDSEAKELQNVKTKVTIAGVIVSTIISMIVTAAGFFWEKK